jgi:hypothetical protein
MEDIDQSLDFGVGFSKEKPTPKPAKVFPKMP